MCVIQELIFMRKIKATIFKCQFLETISVFVCDFDLELQFIKVMLSEWSQKSQTHGRTSHHTCMRDFFSVDKLLFLQYSSPKPVAVFWLHIMLITFVFWILISLNNWKTDFQNVNYWYKKYLYYWYKSFWF